METILVTGGAGYIGSIMVPALLNKGYKITVLDNFMYRQNSLLDVCFNQNLTIINGDVRDYDLLDKLVSKHDIVIPLAAVVGAPACKKRPTESNAINLESIRKLMRILSKGQKVIYPVTNSGYGIGQKDVFCTEESPLNPISQYGREKVEAEKMILERENSIAFRLATVFGVSPRMRLDLLVNDFVYRALNDRFIVLFEAHFKRNYIHIRDVASAFIFALDNFSKMKGNVYNHGLEDANLSKYELCELIKEQMPEFYFIEFEIGQDPDKRNYIVSNKKLHNLGYQPSVTLVTGIKELIKGYQIVNKDKEFSNL